MAELIRALERLDVERQSMPVWNHLSQGADLRIGRAVARWQSGTGRWTPLACVAAAPTRKGFAGLHDGDAAAARLTEASVTMARIVIAWELGEAFRPPRPLSAACRGAVPGRACRCAGTERGATADRGAHHTGHHAAAGTVDAAAIDFGSTSARSTMQICWAIAAVAEAELPTRGCWPGRGFFRMGTR